MINTIQETFESDSLESCYFCNTDTNKWNTQTNMPVCDICASKYELSDIDIEKVEYWNEMSIQHKKNIIANYKELSYYDIISKI